MSKNPDSVLTLLCSGIQLYSAERRIADCILADVKRASSATSAQLSKMSGSSEATVTRLCHKLGFENYRKFQLALARDVMEQQEAEKYKSIRDSDDMGLLLQKIQTNKLEEVRATMQALDPFQLRRAVDVLRSAHVVEIASSPQNATVALELSAKLSDIGKRCVGSAMYDRTRTFAKALTDQDALLLVSSSGRDDTLEELIRAAREKGAPVIIITADRHSLLAQQSDVALIASNREQRLLDRPHSPSQLSSHLVVEVLYYLLLNEEL